MNYPLISEYINAVKAAEENFEQLKNLRPVLDDDGLPVMSGGNFAVVFKMKDMQTGKAHAVKCFLKEQEGRAEAYRMIAEELEFINSTFLTPIKYLEKELFVDSKNSDETEFPVLLMDWIEGQTLDRFIRENIDDQYGLSLLTYQFSRLAMWLMPQPFAHGDLKPDNIIVKNDGTLVLVDYDGMYVPAMKGQKARELGSPDFRHPNRTEADFDEHIDDFSLSNILLSLKAISLQPELLEQYGADDRLLFSEKDFRNLSESQVMDAMKSLMQDAELASLYSMFILALSQNNLSQVSFRLFNLTKPNRFKYEDKSLSTEVTQEDWENSWTDEFGVVYSKDRKKLLGTYTNYLPDYIIPEGTKVICDDALNGFWNETEGLIISGKITIPSTVRYIGRNPFRGDYNTIICKSPYFVVEDNALYTLDKKRLISCFYNGFKFIVPNGVEEIGSFSFNNCNIYIIEIPKSVSNVGDNPFVDAQINYVNIDRDSTFYYAKYGALYRRKPQELVALWAKTNTLFVIDDKTTKICPFAFWNGIERICIPNSIIKIADSAFYGYETKLQQIFIPEHSSKIIETDILAKFESGVEVIGTRKDEYGVMYSGDGKCLLKAPQDIIEYNIKEGTVVIEDFAFVGCYELNNIILPTTLRRIGTCAFWGCGSINQLIIPPSVEEIGTKAFSGCDTLRHIDIPNTITFISERVFEGCETLESVNLCGPVNKIGDFAFHDCFSLVKVSIPESVSEIGRGVFSGCTSLKEINIPDFVDSIGDSTFQNCLSLKQIKLPKNTKEISENVFMWCKSLKCIELPDSVTSIGKYSFLNCKNLYHVCFPKSIKTIGDYTFKGCDKLVSIEIQSTIDSMGKGAFLNCSSLQQIIIPTGTRTKFEELLQEYKDLLVEKDVISHSTRYTDVDIEEGVHDKFGGIYSKDGKRFLRFDDEYTYPFHQCDYIVKNGVEVVCDYAFGDNQYIKRVCLPPTVVMIGNKAFGGCSELEEMDLPINLEWLGDKVFFQCFSMKSLYIPNKVSHVGTNPFAGSGISKVTCSSKCYTTDDYALYDIKKTVLISLFQNVENYIVPQSVVKIGDYSCYRCLNLETIKCQDGVLSVGDNAFDDSSLQMIYLPDTLTSIGEYAFWNTNIPTIYIPSSVENIGEGAFDNCENCHSLIIENGYMQKFEILLSDSKKKIVEVDYAERNERIIRTRSFSKDEIASIESICFTTSHNKRMIKFDIIGGGHITIPLNENTSMSEGDTIDVNYLRLIEYYRNGYIDTCEVLIENNK